MLISLTKQMLYQSLTVSVQRCSRYFSRTFTDFPSTKDLKKHEKKWDLSVSPFTKIKCRLGCNISIKPLDPHVFPKADRAFINVNTTNPDHMTLLDRFNVHYDRQTNELQILDNEINSNNTLISLELAVPVKCDLNIKTKNHGNVKIEKMESDVCHVHTDKGNVVLKAVKGGDVLVHSAAGNVGGFETIHGNVEIRGFGDGNVDIKKIQGTTMNLSTQRGRLKVKAVYGEFTNIKTSSGNIHIGHLHGESVVQSKSGNILIDSSSGSLKVFTAAGNIDSYVNHDGTAELHTKQGSVSVRVPSSIKTGVELCGTSVDISSEISYQETRRSSSREKTNVIACLNGDPCEERWIKATADEGVVALRTQSWFETLRLGDENMKITT